MRTSLWRIIGLFGTTTALLATALSGAGAAPGGGGGPGGPGGGGGEEEEGGKSLAIPTIMVNGGFTGVTCPDGAKNASELVVPTGDPASGFSIDPTASYFVQGVNSWQAQCYTASVQTRVTAAWGDNLTGPAKKTVGHPIRVELTLYNAAAWRPAMDGYTVVKLEPELLDRNSAYGILATGTQGQGFEATPVTFAATEQGVYDGGATFQIKYVKDGSFIVAKGTAASAEINSGGKVVYGYNLRVSEPGRYAIRFHVPDVRVTDTSAGTFKTHVVKLVIEVS